MFHKTIWAYYMGLNSTLVNMDFETVTGNLPESHPVISEKSIPSRMPCYY